VNADGEISNYYPDFLVNVRQAYGCGRNQSAGRKTWKQEPAEATTQELAHA